MKSLKVQRDYVAAQKSFDKRQYHDVLAIINRLLNVDRDPRHYALLGATLVKMQMKTEAAQAFQLAGEQESRHRLKYLREAMRLHFANNDDISLLRIGGKILNEAIADPDMALLMSGALMRQEMEGSSVFQKTLAASDNPEHRRFSIRSIRITTRSEDEHKLIVDTFEREPDDKILRNYYLTVMRDTNNYEVIDKYDPILKAEIDAGQFEPFYDEISLYNIRWCTDERVNAIAGAARVRKPPGVTAKRHAMPHKWNDKIKIGYLSSDLWTEHAVMKAFRGVLEAHDKNKFDITLFCNASEKTIKESNTAARESWGKIISIRSMTDDEAADAIKAENIDVLIDLQGHTADTRVTLMNEMTAPVHATWLGYPGTVVNVDIDYLIADRTVVPESSFANYYEKICWMPETFFPNDAIHRPLPRKIDRRICHMPEDAFIFSSFHTHWKISRTTLDLWIRILKETPGSYLFLICKEAYGSRKNLLKGFTDAGIDADRILFGDRVIDYAAYLDRIAKTDLGLDTYPYNGHTTTSEKLWCGLPMLTHKGVNFASRVSESLLNAVGIPEMICETMDDYVERAVYYFNHREELAEIRGRLERNRFSEPLFDAERFCRHLETAYTMMVDRAKAKKKPDHFAVPALPPREGAFITRTE
ncbi:O-linked N-acetylglucosamine transferase, SPINDLY family protein [Rhizobium terrae]|uniref:O-linked N-acetylglucosamine transferase, SPINDLY family protein n=1 Tax=Rhizobium terrae TaxID=2171756 RepID=UPI0013C32C25|nr:glycosyl transferase [Rhizobium terrae]